jgi:hypothetical protein
MHGQAQQTRVAIPGGVITGVITGVIGGTFGIRPGVTHRDGKPHSHQIARHRGGRLTSHQQAQCRQDSKDEGRHPLR